MVDWEDTGMFLLVIGIAFGIGFGITMSVVSFIIIAIEFPNQFGLLFINGEWQWVALLNFNQWLYILGEALIPALIGGGVGSVVGVIVVLKMQ